jgi:hypothetical protein
MTVRLQNGGNLKKLEAALLEAKEAAEQEFYNLQIAKRGLTDEEKEKAEMLEICLGYIREALSTIKPDKD